jgi:hypothetical protein
MPLNLDTAKIVVWGMIDRYQTHSHIHEGLFRAAKHMRPDSVWIDNSFDQTNFDWDNTIVITEHNPARSERLRVHPGCFYVIHGLNDDEACRFRFKDVKNRLSWNVFHDYSHVYGTQGNPVNDRVIGVPLTDVMWLGEDTPLYPHEKHMDFRWATDLLPYEIDANKPTELLGRDSNVIWYVGSQWWVNQVELNHFMRAAKKDGKEFRLVGAGAEGVPEEDRHKLFGNHSRKVSSIDANVKRIRESFMAPAISGTHHLTEGYVPCRIFKNVSYGMPYATNNLRAHQVMGKGGVYNPDPYKLYWEAKDARKWWAADHQRHIMDHVRDKHTYVNRINGIIKAAKIIEGM